MKCLIFERGFNLLLNLIYNFLLITVDVIYSQDYPNNALQLSN